jgi:tetratricopeptide (TPR) repeat protein
MDWAMTQNNLGSAYIYRIRGDKAQNIEAAIAAYQQALLVRTQTDFPMDWAMTQNNLGIAYSNRIRGDKAQNAAVELSRSWATTDFQINYIAITKIRC